MKTEKLTSIIDLQIGDLIRGKSSGLTYVVTDVLGDRAIAVRTQDITNPSEWEVIRREHEII